MSMTSLSQAVKYTTINPSQLPTTPTAEYVLMNISGRNSYLDPNTTRWRTSQYVTRGTAIARYMAMDRSSRKTLFPELAGAMRSNARRNVMSQNTVYTTLIGNSAYVNRRGNSETWPATARGRKAVRYRRSVMAIRVKGMRTSRIAFSWTCQPKRKEA